MKALITRDEQEISTDLSQISITSRTPLEISGAVIGKLVCKPDGKSTKSDIVLEDCVVWQVHLSESVEIALRLVRCRIGCLKLDKAATRNLVIQDSRIHYFELSPPAEGNPFTGGVQILGKRALPIAKSAVFNQRDQGYRSMREALERLGDSQEGHYFRALELKTEVHDDSWAFKFFSWAYGFAADHGLKVWLPFFGSF